jgi:hypothetical protein
MTTGARTRFYAGHGQPAHDPDIIRLHRWESSHLTLPQLLVLAHIRRSPGITTGHLARLLDIAMSTSSGLVIKLADRGLITRGHTAADRRQAPLYLTPEGVSLLDVPDAPDDDSSTGGAGHTADQIPPVLTDTATGGTR